MATKSFLKSVNLEKRKQIEQLAGALEKAEAVKGQRVVTSRPVVELKESQLAVFCGL